MEIVINVSVLFLLGVGIQLSKGLQEKKIALGSRRTRHLPSNLAGFAPNKEFQSI